MDVDDEEDEEEPLPAEARRKVEHTLDAHKIRHFSFRGLPWIIVLCCLQVVLVRAETALQFPYLRSLQRCKSASTSREWSGSDYCADRVVVTRLAQAEAGYVQGVGMVVHCISLPFLGWVGDRIGRKPLVPGPDPLSAHIDGMPGKLGSTHATAHARTRFEHPNAAPCRAQTTSRHEARETCANHDGIEQSAIGHITSVG